jgi:signal transduction histidine kinase
LERALTKVKEDTVKVNLLNKLTQQFVDSNPDKAMGFASQAFDLAQTVHFKLGLATAYLNMGAVYYNKSKYPDAIANYLESLQLEKEIKDNHGLVACYNGISQVYKYQGKYKEASEYCDLSLKISKQGGVQKEIAESYYCKGNILWAQGAMDEAMQYLTSSLKIAEQINDKKGIAISCNSIGGINSDRGVYPLALEYYYRSLKILEEINNNRFLAIIYNNIGGIYRYQNKNDEALQCFFKALEIAKKMNNKTSIGQCYHKIGTIYDGEEKYDEALKYYLQSLKIKEEIGDKKGIGESYNNLGVMFKYEKKYDVSLNYLFKALKIKEEIGDKKGLINTNNNIGSVLAKQNKFNESIKYLTTGMNLAKDVGARDMLRDNYYMFSEMYAQRHNYEKAFEFHLLYSKIKDSILDIENSKHLSELQTQYKTEQKEQEIAVLKQKQQIAELNITKQSLLVQKRNYAIAIMVFVFLAAFIISYLLFNRYKIIQKQKQKNAVMETEEKERMRISKDIHDELGAGLSKITLMAEFSKQHFNGSKELNDNITSISKISKGLIDSMRDLIWTLNPHNSTLGNLVSRIREYSSEFLDEFPIVTTFDFSEYIPDLPIGKEALHNIFLVVKEALNNCVKHSQASAVSIRVNYENNFFDIVITDNGKGFDLLKLKTTGNGLYYMKQRIESIGGNFNIESGLNQGTTVKIKFFSEAMKLTQEN